MDEKKKISMTATIAQWNIQSLRNLSTLKQLIKGVNPILCIINESRR